MKLTDAAWIRFEHVQTTLSSAGAKVVVPVGAYAIAQRLFRHDPPLSGEIEQAIDVVEEALDSTGLRYSERGDLQSTDPKLLDILGLRAGDILLTCEQVEMQFECLASMTLGQPAARGPTALSSEGDSMLIILRECMHHLGYQGIHRVTG